MKFPVFDLHCDTTLRPWRHGIEMWENDGHISFKRGLELPGYAQCFAFFMSFFKDEGPEKFEEAYAVFQAQLEKNKEVAVQCRTADEVQAALDRKKIAAVLTIEGAEALGCDPGRIDSAVEKGIRMVGLTWNFENALSGSCKTGNGLTDTGREFVRRAQKAHILIDTSHLSEKGFYDICDITEGPVMASHSNAAGVFPHERNLTDEQFKLICQTGGCAGINLYAAFLGEKDVTFETVYQHIDHFLQLGGENHIALGGDLDGCEELPQGFNHVDDYNALGEFLVQRGLSEQTVANIFYHNFAKVVAL